MTCRSPWTVESKLHARWDRSHPFSVIDDSDRLFAVDLSFEPFVTTVNSNLNPPTPVDLEVNLDELARAPLEDLLFGKGPNPNSISS